MGRHTKAFDEEPGGYEPQGHGPSMQPSAPFASQPQQYAPPSPATGPAPAVQGQSPEAKPSAPRFAWIGRVPLLPALAGLVAVGIVATAYGTSNISLNFSGGAPTQPRANPQCGPDACPDPQASGDTRASRGSSRPSPVEVSFTTAPWTGGFKGTVTVANNGAQPLKGWTLTFSIPNAQVLSLSGMVVVVRKGATTTIRTQHVLAPGSTSKVTFLAHGTAGDPTTCTFDKAPCPVPAATP